MAEKTEKFSEAALLEMLKAVKNPELRYSIVDLGLVYRAEQTEDGIEVDFTLTYIGCPLEAQLRRDIERTLQKKTGIRPVRARLVWNPPWTIDRASDEIRLNMGYAIW
jgi:metal-sulfur cluster biosynthetic enzyme